MTREGMAAGLEWMLQLSMAPMKRNRYTSTGA